MKLALASVLVFSLALTVFASQSEQDEKDVSQQDQRSVRAAVGVKEALGSQGGVSRRTRNAGPDKERRKKKGGKKRKAKKGKKRGGKKRASKGKQKKRKTGKGKKRKHRSGKRKRTKGKKKTGKAKFKSGNAKGRRLKQGGSRASSTRQGGAVYTGSACEYVSVTRLQASGSGCVHGTKFVIKPGTGTRRQFLNMDGEAIIGFVQQGTKFADCATNGGFKDVTGSINCKEVDGLAAAHLNQTGSGGSATTAGPGGSTTAGCQCGVSRNSRIINGTVSQTGDWPWYSLILATVGGDIARVCGGSLISETWVVSAAHCIILQFPNGTVITLTPSITSVGLGTYDLAQLNNSQINPNAQRVGVSNIITHPSYSPIPLINDIALIKLTTKVDISFFIPVCLPAATGSFFGQTVDIIGMGAVSPDGNQSTTQLQEGQMVVVSQEECAADFEATSIPISIFCGGNTQQSPCIGDSGGPAMTSDKGSPEVHTMVGVTSFGHQLCGESELGRFSGFTNVSFFIDWIRTTVASNGGLGNTCG